MPRLLSTTCILLYEISSLSVASVTAIAVVLVFTHMVSQAIAPSHQRTIEISSSRTQNLTTSFIPKKYSSAINNTQSKINATFLWWSGSSGGGITLYLCLLFLSPRGLSPFGNFAYYLPSRPKSHFCAGWQKCTNNMFFFSACVGAFSISSDQNNPIGLSPGIIFSNFCTNREV